MNPLLSLLLLAEVAEAGFFVLLLIGLAVLALWLWALIDIIKNTKLSPAERIVWIIVIFIVPLLGAAVYLIVSKSKR